jgi:hypothetical protein
MGHTIDDTSGSSGFGFSIKSYIAMMTDYQRSILPDSSNPGLKFSSLGMSPTQRG